MSISLVLTALTGPKRGSQLKLGAGHWILGRAPEVNGDSSSVDLTEFDAEERVSRNHARVDVSADGARVQDLDSLNGTFVNNAPIPARHEQDLAHGDVVVFGAVGFRVDVVE